MPFSFFVSSDGPDIFGQSADSVSKMIFQYGIGHSSWDENGVYSNEERIEIEKNKKDNFKISEYRKIERRRVKGKYFADTVFLKVKGYPVISRSNIVNLFSAINTSQDNFNAEFVSPYLSHPNKSEILKIAHDIDQYEMFTDSDSEKKDRTRWFNEMRGFKDLHLFMEQRKPDPNLFTVVNDVWDYMRLSCINQKDTIKFNMQFIDQLAGQPIEKFKRHSYDTDKGIVNLRVNLIVIDLLPIGSLLRKSVSLESLKEEYIKWYIKNNLHF